MSPIKDIDISFGESILVNVHLQKWDAKECRWVTPFVGCEEDRFPFTVIKVEIVCILDGGD